MWFDYSLNLLSEITHSRLYALYWFRYNYIVIVPVQSRSDLTMKLLIPIEEKKWLNKDSYFAKHCSAKYENKFAFNWNHFARSAWSFFCGCTSLSQIRKSCRTHKSPKYHFFYLSWWFTTRHHYHTALTCEKPPQIQTSFWILSSSVALNLSLSAPVRSFRFITRWRRMMSCKWSPQLESRVMCLIVSDMWVPTLWSPSGFPSALTQSGGTVREVR